MYTNTLCIEYSYKFMYMYTYNVSKYAELTIKQYGDGFCKNKKRGPNRISF